MRASDGQRVFVAEYGHGGRPARVIRSYTDQGGRERIIVAFDDATATAHRDCFATSVFATEAEADAASV